MKWQLRTQPLAEAVAKMMEYNKSLQKAGALLGLDGLLLRPGHLFPTWTARQRLQKYRSAESKEAIGGYWIIQVCSREEPLEWARRAPMANNEIIEVRQIYERADFSIVVQKEAVQKAAEGFEELSNAAAAKA